MLLKYFTESAPGASEEAPAGACSFSGNAPCGMSHEGNPGRLPRDSAPLARRAGDQTQPLTHQWVPMRLSGLPPCSPLGPLPFLCFFSSCISHPSRELPLVPPGDPEPGAASRAPGLSFKAWPQPCDSVNVCMCLGLRVCVRIYLILVISDASIRSLRRTNGDASAKHLKSCSRARVALEST